MRLVLIFFFLNKMKHNILVPRTAIILPSAPDRELRLVPKQEVTNGGFQLSAQPQEFEKISLTNLAQLLIHERETKALDLWR